MIKTKSLRHYKELKKRGITCELVTKQGLKQKHEQK